MKLIGLIIFGLVICTVVHYMGAWEENSSKEMAADLGQVTGKPSGQGHFSEPPMSDKDRAFAKSESEARTFIFYLWLVMCVLIIIFGKVVDTGEVFQGVSLVISTIIFGLLYWLFS